MQAKVIAIKEKPSRNGGKMFIVCMQSFEPKSRSLITYVYPGTGNYGRWKRIIDHVETHEIVLDGLMILKNRIVNADSLFMTRMTKKVNEENGKTKEAICQTSQ